MSVRSHPFYFHARHIPYLNSDVKLNNDVMHSTDSACLKLEFTSVTAKSVIFEVPNYLSSVEISTDKNKNTVYYDKMLT